MTETGKSSDLPQQEHTTEAEKFPENDKIFDLLRRFEAGFGKHHLIVGGIGVAGVLGRETRIIHDFDAIISKADLAEAGDLLSTLGFQSVSAPETFARLHGNEGKVFQRPSDGLIADVAVGEFQDDGLINPIASGSVFIPTPGLDYEVSLRGIKFQTLSPEVHYFFKNRATRRIPWQTIFIPNRQKDEDDFRQLTKTVDPRKANELIRLGLKYTGQHPLPARILSEIKSRLG